MSLKTKTRDLIKKDRRYVWHPFTQMQEWGEASPIVVIEKGDAVYLQDTEGNRYLDGVSSLWVNVHGHGKKEINQALRRQIKKLAHSTLLGLANEPSILLAEKLVELAPRGLGKVFFSDCGSTAVEIAIKMALQYWQQKDGGKFKQKTLFLKLDGAYHGDTLGAVSVGGIDLFHRIYSPLLFSAVTASAPHCYRCPLTSRPASHPNLRVSGNRARLNPASRGDCRWECAAALEELVVKQAPRLAAVIVEPVIQGAGGMRVAPPGYLKKVREICSQNQVLLIADEVATGFGRTGEMFACAHEGVTPDLMAVAKGITGGYLPLAATLTTQEIYDAFCGAHEEKKTFFHGHTYTGNPLACAAALANLKLFEEEKTLERLQPQIHFLEQELKRFADLPCVGEVRQAGMMAGIELVRDKATKEPYIWEEKIGARVCLEARRRGALLRPLGNVVVLMPPLSITREQLEKLVRIVWDCIEVVCGNGRGHN